MKISGVAQEEAAKILGEDFLSLGDMKRFFGSEPPVKMADKMATVNFSSDFLRENAGNIVVFPGTSRIYGDLFSMSYLDTGKNSTGSKPFISKYNFRDFQGAKFWFRPPLNRWYAISKFPAEESRGLSFFEQDYLLTLAQRRESAVVYAIAAFAHFMKAGKHLWQDCIIWTADRLRGGKQVAVGGWSDEETSHCWSIVPIPPERVGTEQSRLVLVPSFLPQ